MSTRVRLLVFGVAAVLLLGAAAGYAIGARGDHAPDSAARDAQLTGERVLVVSDGHLAAVSASDPSAPREIFDVSCVRAYAAGGTGVCLRQQDPWTYTLHPLDGKFRDAASFTLPGLPSRARVSASGRMVSWTVFISGESYQFGGFSTRTGILDTKTGQRFDSIESFAITRDGKPYRGADVNYWGVSFARDDNTFYATLSTAGQQYLVRGDFAERTVTTITTNVECPSLSPDGTRVAFKLKRGATPAEGWQPAVLDLATLAVTKLPETRMIDDQPAWLDDETVAYTFRDSGGNPSVWAVAADASGKPWLVADQAESPAPLR